MDIASLPYYQKTAAWLTCVVAVVYTCIRILQFCKLILECAPHLPIGTTAEQDEVRYCASNHNFPSTPPA